MKKLVFIFLCLLNINITYADEMADDRQNAINIAVQKFKDVIKTDDPQIIAEYVVYPYGTRNPLPDIKNKTDFIKYYDMVLDDELKQLINDSKLEDWASGGWRGIMLYSGVVWIDEYGKLKAVNYTTQKGREYIGKWYQRDKSTIYEPLRQYEDNIYIFKTDTKLGRIDEIKTEQDKKYRLALWDKDEDMSTKPQVLISDGTVEYLGSVNNTEYYFKSGGYEYVFFVTYAGPRDMVPYELSIYKNTDRIDGEEPISTEEAHIVR